MRSPSRSYEDVVLEQLRGVTGGLLVVGLEFLYTMETWWLGWGLPLRYLVPYAVFGLVGVYIITRNIGFREDDRGRGGRRELRVVTDFAELVLQSFVAAYITLLAFGIIELSDSLITVVRLGLIQIVPLGFGAAVANQLLSDSGHAGREGSFPQYLTTFAIGALFISFPIAPTQEMEVIALETSWPRLAGLVILSVLVVHLVLHELEFRGHTRRTKTRSIAAQVGTAFTAYLVGAVVAVVMLVSFGHFAETTAVEWVQLTIVLSFLTSIGASAGEVVL